MTKIRTRYAPSPTGKMHVGNLRSALYEFLIAKHAGGDFMLRIEDTDQERYVEGATEIIYRTLEKTGLVHDEGPDKDGGYGPYVQSERMKTGIYMKYAKELIDKGEAYYCFCDKERLASLKTEVVDGKEITVYDKHCLSLSKEEIEANLAAGKPFVIRQNNPKEGTTTFHDELYGDITVDNSQLDDMILIKSDGYPTYNFANVVDDHTMNITHVVRGNEYLSSAPKYQRLYDAFGWESPVYIHLPLITDENHKKLSKRSGHASFEDLLEQGFLPEAIVNYIALLGWSPEDNREIFTLDELIRGFDYHRISKSPAVFDIVKLKWMNGEYLKAMDFDAFYEDKKMRTTHVVVKPYDKKWKMDFEDIKKEIQSAIGDLILGIEHVGSTSVEGLSAKPCIDLDIVIKDYSVFEDVVRGLQAIGYIHEGNLGIKDREAFRYLDKPHLQTHHLYVCPQNSKELYRHITFREFLRNHPAEVKKYSEVKERAAQLFPEDIDKYMEYKSQCIEELYALCGLK